MGIRYYAYAFDADQTDAALADPRSVIGADPLADAWGMEPGFTVGVMGERARLPERDLLYLDKAWSPLGRAVGALEASRQASVAGQGQGPVEVCTAADLFEGDVTPTQWGWAPFLRTISPAQARGVGEGLDKISDAEIEAVLRDQPGGPRGREVEHLIYFVGKARVFVAGVVAEGRGFVYMIG